MRTLFLLPILLISAFLHSQNTTTKTIAGLVTDYNGRALHDVHVASIKKGYGTTTNKKGYFKLEVEAPDSIRFVYVGMKEKVYSITHASDKITIINILLEPTSYFLKEFKVSPYLSKKHLSYDKLPMDATESTRLDLRTRALNTDKTRFSTFGFNFAPGILSLFSSSRKRIPDENDPQRIKKIREMQLKLASKSDSAFKNSIPIDSMNHPSRKVFKEGG